MTLLEIAPLPQDRVVLCMKWGTLYSADYVNVLYNACNANITGPFRFVCLTDDRTGILASVECFSIPEIGCTPEMWLHGAWPKLSVFSENLFGITGRALFIDMDSVICGSLDRFFEHSGRITTIDTGKNWHPGPQRSFHQPLAGTGVFAFTIGDQSPILEKFQVSPVLAFSEGDIEQVWAQKHAEGLTFWPKEWVISFKRWLRRPIGIDLFAPPRHPPRSASIVAFHGNPRPIELLQPGFHHWDRIPHLGHGQVSWMLEYWTSYGGRIPDRKRSGQ